MDSDEKARQSTDDKQDYKLGIKDSRKRKFSGKPKKRSEKRSNEVVGIIDDISCQNAKSSGENSMVEVIDVEQFKDKPIVDLTNDTLVDIYVDLTKESPKAAKRTRLPDTQDYTDNESVISIKSPKNDESCQIDKSESKNATTIDDAVTCAICMSSLSQIKKDKHQLMSTICGHVFCNVCILSALSSQAKCPTCRKKVTKKQLHPIYI